MLCGSFCHLLVHAYCYALFIYAFDSLFIIRGRCLGKVFPLTPPETRVGALHVTRRQGSLDCWVCSVINVYPCKARVTTSLAKEQHTDSCFIKTPTTLVTKEVTWLFSWLPWKSLRDHPPAEINSVCLRGRKSTFSFDKYDSMFICTYERWHDIPIYWIIKESRLITANCQFLVFLLNKLSILNPRKEYKI